MSRGRWTGVLALVCALVYGAACAPEAPPSIALVRVAPSVDPGCGVAEDGRTLVITALGDFPAAEVATVTRDIDSNNNSGNSAAPFVIDSFASTTRVLRVEVLGDAGARRTVGRSAPLTLGQLRGGDDVAVFMAPPRGVCATGPLLVPRALPLLARAGRHALVAGGLDGTVAADGTPRAALTIERYDPTTGAFSDTGLEHYGSTSEHGLIGASMTGVTGVGSGLDAGSGLGSGDADAAGDTSHVVIAGGGAPWFQVYDVASGTLSEVFALQPRAFHAAVDLGDGRVLLAGGCSPLGVDHTCSPSSAVTTTAIIDVTSAVTGTDAGVDVRPGPRLARARIHGTAVRESHETVVLIGGIDDRGAPVTDIERIHLSGAASDIISGDASGNGVGDGAGAAASLASGSTLFGTGYPGGAPAPSLAVLPARALQTTPIAAAPWPLSRASMTPLEDGRVLVIGSRPDGAAFLGLFQPQSADFLDIDSRLAAELPGAEHGTLRLADGTVLVIGGRPQGAPLGAPRSSAWIIRPDLTGPFSSDLYLPPSDRELVQHLIPRDPSRHTYVAVDGAVPAHWLMRASAGGGALPAEWAIIAGPIFTHGRLSARVRSAGGGLALMVGFRAADEYLAVTLSPGQPATAYLVAEGAASVVSGCQGRVVGVDDLTPADPAAAVLATLDFTDARSLRVTLDNEAVLTCDALAEPVPRGLLGVGVVGVEDAGLRVDLVTAAR